MLRDLIDIMVKSQLVSCGRGFGKTMLTGCSALYFVDEYAKTVGKPITVLLISAQKAIYDEIDKFFQNDKLLKPRLRQQPSGTSGYEIPRERLQFSDTMSTIYNVLPTIKQVEGIRADVIIFDESQDIPSAVYNKAIGTLKKDLIGKIICVGTPYVDKGTWSNWFISKCIEPDNDPNYKFLLSQHSSRNCTWNDVDRWLGEWSPARIKAEIDGFPPTRAEIEFFNQVKWQACFVNCTCDREGRNEKHTVEIGIDWGYGAPNPTVITVTEKLSTKRKFLLQEVQKNVDFDRLEAICALYPDSLIKVDSQPDEFITQFKKVHKGPFHKVDAKIHKDMMMSQFQARVLMTQLKIPDIFVDLYKEGVRYHPKKRAGDNRIDSAAIACYEPVVPYNDKPPFKMIIIGPSSNHKKFPWEK
jgi:hypothetical protein